MNDENMLGEKLVSLRKKHGYSQQEVADMLSVTRQTISNWECGQGSPTLDKALLLAKIYKISLDDLAGNDVEITAKEMGQESKRDRHILKKLIGRTCRLECDFETFLMEDVSGSELTGEIRARVLDVNDTWMRIEYERTKEGKIFQKETVVKLLDLSVISGIEAVETEVEE